MHRSKETYDYMHTWIFMESCAKETNSTTLQRRDVWIHANIIIHGNLCKKTHLLALLKRRVDACKPEVSWKLVQTRLVRIHSSKETYEYIQTCISKETCANETYVDTLLKRDLWIHANVHSCGKETYEYMNTFSQTHTRKHTHTMHKSKTGIQRYVCVFEGGGAGIVLHVCALCFCVRARVRVCLCVFARVYVCFSRVCIYVYGYVYVRVDLHLKICIYLYIYT